MNYKHIYLLALLALLANTGFCKFTSTEFSTKRREVRLVPNELYKSAMVQYFLFFIVLFIVGMILSRIDMCWVMLVKIHQWLTLEKLLYVSVIWLLLMYGAYWLLHWGFILEYRAVKLGILLSVTNIFFVVVSYLYYFCVKIYEGDFEWDMDSIKEEMTHAYDKIKGLLPSDASHSKDKKGKEGNLTHVTKETNSFKRHSRALRDDHQQISESQKSETDSSTMKKDSREPHLLTDHSKSLNAKPIVKNMRRRSLSSISTAHVKDYAQSSSSSNSEDERSIVPSKAVIDASPKSRENPTTTLNQIENSSEESTQLLSPAVSATQKLEIEEDSTFPTKPADFPHSDEDTTTTTTTTTTNTTNTTVDLSQNISRSKDSECDDDMTSQTTGLNPNKAMNSSSTFETSDVYEDVSSVQDSTKLPDVTSVSNSSMVFSPIPEDVVPTIDSREEEPDKPSNNEDESREIMPESMTSVTTEPPELINKSMDGTVTSVHQDPTHKTETSSEKDDLEKNFTDKDTGRSSSPIRDDDSILTDPPPSPSAIDDLSATDTTIESTTTDAICTQQSKNNFEKNLDLVNHITLSSSHTDTESVQEEEASSSSSNSNEHVESSLTSSSSSNSSAQDDVSSARLSLDAPQTPITISTTHSPIDIDKERIQNEVQKIILDMFNKDAERGAEIMRNIKRRKIKRPLVEADQENYSPPKDDYDKLTPTRKRLRDVKLRAYAERLKQRQLTQSSNDSSQNPSTLSESQKEHTEILSKDNETTSINGSLLTRDSIAEREIIVQTSV